MSDTICIDLPPREGRKGEVRARLLLRAPSSYVQPYIEISGKGHNNAIIHLTPDDVRRIMELSE